MFPVLCLALAVADPDRPLVPVATLGKATMICRDHGRIFATPDGKRAVTRHGEWFDLEAGRPISPPFPLPDGSHIHSVLDDGTVVVESAKHLHFYPPGAAKPNRTLETLGRRAWLSGDGSVAVSQQGFTDDSCSLLVADKSGEWKTVAESMPPAVRVVVNETHAAMLFAGIGDVAVFELKTKKRTDFLEERPKPPPRGPNGEILIQCFAGNRRTDVALSPDGKVVYVTRELGYVAAHDSDTDAELKDKSFEARWWQGVPALHVSVCRQFENNHLAWIGDGLKQVRVTDGGVLRVFNSVTGKQIDEHSPYPGFFGVKAIDDRRAIAWTECGRIVTWDLTTGKPTAEVQLEEVAPNFLRFGEVTMSSDGNEVIARDISDYGRSVHADARTGRKLYGDLRLHPLFGPDGGVLIFSSSHNTLSKPGGDTPLASEVGIHSPKVWFHFDPAGRLAVAVTLRGVEVFELATGKRLWDPKLPEEHLTRMNGGGIRTSGLCGRILVLVREADALVFDLPTQRLTRQFNIGGNEYTRSAISADGKWLVVATASKFGALHTFTLYPLDHPNPPAVAVELPILTTTYTTGLAFTPDGKTLLTSHAGGTAHAWDVSRFTCPAVNPREGELWAALGSDDGKIVGEVMVELVQTPRATVALLSKRLMPAERIDEKAIKARIAELGSTGFRTREAATVSLTAMDERAVPLLKAAAVATTVPEVGERIERVLSAIEAREIPPDWPRQLRAVELLETLGTPEAKRVLTSLAAGAPGARLTAEAERTLNRLHQK